MPTNILLASGLEKYDPEKERYRPRKEPNLIPPFKKKSLSDNFIRNNPKYKDVFHKCPSCGKNSLVNIDYHARPIKGRICRECNYSNDGLE